MYGFYNKLLRIDLTEKRYSVEEIEDAVFENYLGGKGLGTFLLLQEVRPDIDPLSLGNKLIITTGLLAGTAMMGVSRYGVFTKSPLTNIYSESYSGGHTGPVIKRTGYDAVIIEGAAGSPVVIEISDEAVRFHDAELIWGKDTYESEDKILSLVNKDDAQAIVIGPAGENMVRFACIENNYWRSAGRTGVGAVLGSKKVKGIVFHGGKKSEAAYPDLLRKYVRDFVARHKDDGGTIAYRKFGTPILVSIMNSVNGFPARYWQEGSVDYWESISADYMQKEMNIKPKSCHQCFFACGKLTEVTKGEYKGLTIEGPEYETIYAFGGLCCVRSMEEIVYLNDICDRLGMDTITAGNLAAFTIEAAKRGAIEYDIDYGDVEAIAKLLYKIAYKKDIGEVLAEGIVKASREWKLESIAIHVKGLEPAGYDPRILKGMGLAYAVSDRGACHLRSTFYKPELSGVIDRNRINGKARLLVEYEDRLALFDSLIICRFFRDIVTWEDLSVLIKAVTGLELNYEDLRKTAENIIDLTRIFNLKCGVTKKDDTLPERFFNEPVGPDKETIAERDLELMLQQYYRERGWDGEGIPKACKL